MIQEGDLVYFLDPNGKKLFFRAAEGMIKVPSLGAVDGSKIIGSEDGTTITIIGKEFTLYVPGTIDLMDSLDRGAQIITPKDAATILLKCDIHSGTKVLEVGAGSGGLTTALLSAVAPSGSVHTIEFKEENAQRTLRNVRRTGLDQHWSFTIGDARDVRPDYVADVLTMDMPDPWLALDNLSPCLRSGGRLCAYVPNYNQVEEIVRALRERNFSEVHALENIQRGIEVHPGGVRPSFDNLGHTAFLVFARKRC